MKKTIDLAQDAVIDSAEYLTAFGINERSVRAADVWKHILERLVRSGNNALEKWKNEINVILQEGSLSSRIVRALGQDQSQENIVRVYKQLSGCLAQNKMFFG